MGHAAHWWWKSARRTDAALLAALLLAMPVAAQAPAAAPDFSRFALEQAKGAPQTGLKIIPLTLYPAGRAPVAYKVEVAATPRQQEIGMMYRRRMAPGTGMLFPMDPPRATAFWMRNTYLPLDIIFIAPDRRILRISARTPPLSDDQVPSGGVAMAVLELAAGEAERIGLRVGDTVRW